MRSGPLSVLETMTRTGRIFLNASFGFDHTLYDGFDTYNERDKKMVDGHSFSDIFADHSAGAFSAYVNGIYPCRR